MKVCTNCKNEKTIENFPKDKKKPDGHRGECKECVGAYNKQRYQLNKKKINNNCKAYYHQNKEKRNEQRRIYQLSRRKSDINYKLADNLRSRLRKAIKNNQKAGSAIQDLSCTIEELKTYLESQFQDDDVG